MADSDYDLIVLGGGSGGLAMAIRAATHGAKVALLEPGELGGTCVNVGCIPKKAMWLAAEMAMFQRTSAQLGFEGAAGRLDWPAFIDRRQAYIGKVHASYQRKLDELGIERLPAYGRLLGGGRVDAGSRELTAPHIVIATGAKALRPEVPGAEFGMDSNGFFALREAPARVALIGGGYIAVELAGLLHALGSQVSMILRGDKLLPAFDRECSSHLADLYESHGLQLVRGVDVSALERAGNGTRVLGSKAPDQVFDCVIWATGRGPASAELGLDQAGIACDDKGHIVIDHQQNTSVDGIYAVGDVTTDLALTPVAVKAGRCLAERLFSHDKAAALDRRLIPTVVFGTPPMASVGLGEEDAIRSFGSEVRVYSTRFRPILGALADQPDQTLMKLVCVGDDKRVIGLHMVGVGVDEMIQGFALALKLGATKTDFDHVVAVHPTAAEELVLMGSRSRNGKEM